MDAYIWDPSAVPSPCFVLELGRLQENLAAIRMVRDHAGVEVLFALKAFAMSRVFAEIATVASGATVSSLSEAVHAAATFGENLHAYAPAYNENEFDELVGLCRYITFNSVSQLERFCSRSGNCSIGLRVNPGYSDVETDMYNPCAPGCRLGVTSEELTAGLPEGVEGLHVHNLCESGAKATALTIENLEQRYGRVLNGVDWLNLGGGHLMTREGYDTASLVSALRGLQQRRPHLSVILEPGAAFVWDAGVLVSSVLDVIDRCGVRTAVLDVSFACHMPDCLEMPYTPRIDGAEIVGKGEGGWRLGGCSCLAGDFVGEYRFQRPPRIGDRIVFRDMMHYTMVKTTTFNGVRHPSIGLIDKAGRFELVRTFGAEEYCSRNT